MVLFPWFNPKRALENHPQSNCLAHVYASFLAGAFVIYMIIKLLILFYSLCNNHQIHPTNDVFIMMMMMMMMMVMWLFHKSLNPGFAWQFQLCPVRWKKWVLVGSNGSFVVWMYMLNLDNLLRKEPRSPAGFFCSSFKLTTFHRSQNNHFACA